MADAPDRPDFDEPQPRNRTRDFWQLDVPLVVALVICVSATIIEARRATDGNWRAVIYAVEWPLIGAFCVWIWYRFKKQGPSVASLTQRWRDRAAAMEDEARATEPPTDLSVADNAPDAAPDDPQLAAWQQYQRDLRQRDGVDGPG